MSYLIVLLVSSLFVIFFSLIGTRYFWIFPLLFFVIFFSQSFIDFRLKFQDTDLLKRYGLYWISLLIFFWLLWLFEFFWLSYESSFFILLLIAWFARYLSYFLDYEDWKQIFFHGFLFILCLIVWNNFIIESTFWLPGILWLISILLILGFWGLRYWIGSFKEVKPIYQYYFYLSIFLAILDIPFLLWSNPLYAMDLDSLFYLILLSTFSYIVCHLPRQKSWRRREVSLRRVLAGEKVLEANKKPEILFYDTVANFVKETPDYIKNLFEILGVSLLIWVLITYLMPLFKWEVIPQMRYWAGILFFLASAFLLKKYRLFTNISRFAVVLIVNFSLYISLIAFGDNWIYSMVPWLVARNILCGILILYAKMPVVKTYLKQMDLVFWLLANLVAMLLNIYLLIKLPNQPWQIIFSLIFIYVGAQWWITYYAVQLIKEYWENSIWEETDEEKLDEYVDKNIQL